MDTHYKRIILKKGGHLFVEYNEWENDVSTEKSLEIKDSVPVHYLHGLPFELEDGVTLEDICLYVNQNIEYWDILIENCIKDYVDDILNNPIMEDDGIKIETCVLSWGMEASKYDNKVVTNFPHLNFGMKGKDENGKEINYGFGGGSVACYKNLPVIIDRKLSISYENLDNFFFEKEKWNEDDSLEAYFNRKNIFQKLWPWGYSKYWNFVYRMKHTQKDYGTMDVTLFNVIYGIFWELSFHGGPNDRKEFFNGLSNQIDEIKELNASSK